MNLLFTEAVERTLIEAAHWADDPFDPQLFLPGAFYGLLRESESRAATILFEAGITVEKIRERWPELKRTDLRAAGWPELSQRPRVFDEKIVVVHGLCGTLRRALRNMQRLLWDFPRPMTIATEHLLLALVTSPSDCGEFLRQAGLDADSLETRIRCWYGYEHRVVEGGDGLPIRIDDEDAEDSGQDSLEEKGRILSILGEIGLLDPVVSIPSPESIPSAESATSTESATSAGPVTTTQMNTADTTSQKSTAPLENSTSAQDTTTKTNSETPLPEISEQMSTWRVLDAAGNRAREALRVLEDHARFVWDQPYLTEQFKRLRHELCEAIDQLPLAQRLAARNTSGDVGTRITTPSELTRASTSVVLTANFCRLQESLRSLEEYSKILAPELSRSFERIRYAVYTLQRTTRAMGADVDSLAGRLAAAKLCLLIAGTNSTREFAQRILPLAASGTIDMIQLRDKTLDDRRLLRRARVLREITAKYGILFIMNDRSDLALLSDADGVHLGQREIPVADARRILGTNRLIGVSTHRKDQAESAILAGADYLGVGPIFPSSTKSFTEYPGLAYLSEVAGTLAQPAFAIGGITQENFPQVWAAGGRRVAVSSAITQSDQPIVIAEAIRSLLDQEG